MHTPLPTQNQPPPQPKPQKQNTASPKVNPPAAPVQTQHKTASPVDKVKGPKMEHCSSPSSSEDSGINALGLHFMESCEDDSEEDDGLSTDGNSSPSSLWDQDECALLSPSKSMIEIIEKIETTV